MKNRPLGAIDIGTNTFRLLIASVRYNPRKDIYSINEIFSDRTITRLGSGISRNGFLKNEAIKKSLTVLGKFSDILSQYDVHNISAVATSALREAKNSDEFLKKAKAATGLNIKIISGEEEARKTASGMLIDISAPDTSLMVDIGGGSTELIFSRHGKPSIVHSLNLGVVYLAGKYMKHDPPLKEDLIKMDRYISQEIGKIVKPYLKLISHNSKLKTAFIGTAGTITTLAAVAKKLKIFEHKKIHAARLTRRKVKNIFCAISAVSSHERGKFIPFEPSRLDIIVPGTLILLKLMEIFNFKEITVSNYGLREGVLIELYKKSEKKGFN
ncbi:MAG: Ppx/GppA family phosphatase [Nitrospirae bacterium]|nr:Ppx/GppA family phosphatase [Nitrospirota bacterium]